jgi:hypothetical protein
VVGGNERTALNVLVDKVGDGKADQYLHQSGLIECSNNKKKKKKKE